MFLSHSSCVTAWTTSIHWCELGVRGIVWIVMSCEELLKIVTPMWWLYCCASKVPTDYSWCWWILWDRTLHSWRYICMMKIENAFICSVLLWVEKIPTLSRGPVGLGTPCEWTMILTSSEMSTFSLCVCLFVTKNEFFFHFVSVCFFRRTSTFSLWESRK